MTSCVFFGTLFLAAFFFFMDGEAWTAYERFTDSHFQSLTSPTPPLWRTLKGVVQDMVNNQNASWHYVVAMEEIAGAKRIGNGWLKASSALPVILVSDPDGNDLGCLLGFPLDIVERQTLADTWTLPFSCDGDRAATIRRAQRYLAGRFLWVVPVGASLQIYPDCSAQVPCVFDPQSGRAGSSADAMLSDEEYEQRFLGDLYARLGVDGQGCFPAGLTAHDGLSRLLPYHVLDLGTMTAKRAWPQGPLKSSDEPEVIIDEMISLIRAQFEAMLAGSKRVACSLTAGADTRMLLACARPYLDQIEFVTVTSGKQHDVDTIMARRLAKDLQLRHLVLPQIRASEEQREIFLRRGGHCNGDGNSYFHPSVWPIAKTHTLATGVGGGLLKGFYWRKDDHAASQITTSQMIDRMGLPRDTRVEQALQHWFSELDSCDTLTTLDLAYQDHRDACWYAPQFPCDPTLVRYAPLMTDHMVELILTLPSEWKREGRVVHEVVKRCWPELSRYPYNSLGFVRNSLARINQLISDPRLVIKKFRKMRS